MAAWSAVAEGVAADGDQQLIAADLLPRGFAERIDASTMASSESGVIDTRRGAPGFFVPIADMEIEKVSRQELEIYQKFIERYQSDIGQMPPIAVGINRTEGGAK